MAAREQKVRLHGPTPPPAGALPGGLQAELLQPSHIPSELVQGGLNSNSLGPSWAHSRCAGSRAELRSTLRTP